MDVKKCGTIKSLRAPAKYFTGTVWQERLPEPEAPARLAAILVRFEPGARTFWHKHRLGQTLYIISGSGLAQSWDGPIERIRAGDVVSFAPGEKHWHGAGPETVMEHLAMQERLDGEATDWLEQVSDEQYAAAAS